KAGRRQQAEIERHLGDARWRAAALVDPLNGFVALDLDAVLLAWWTVALVHVLADGHTRLDAAPIRRRRRPGQNEQSEQQREQRHQNPRAAPSPRGSAPPRSVPSSNVIP